MSDRAETAPTEVETVVIPEDAGVREALRGALGSLPAGAAAGPDVADRVQDTLRERWPAADVLYESASAPGTSGRARWTIYRDGADAA